MPPGVAVYLLGHGIELALILLFGYGCYRDGRNAGRSDAELEAKFARRPRIEGCPVIDYDRDQPGCSDHRPAPQPRCVLPHRDWPDGCKRTSTTTVGLACGWHRGQLDQLIDAIHEGYVSLSLIEVAGSAPKESAPKTRHTKSASPPAPANLDVLVLRDPRTEWDRDAQGRLRRGELPSVPAVVASWLQLLAAERPLTAVLPKSVLGQLDMLRRHHDWIAAQEWVGDYLTEFTELRTGINTALRDRPVLRTLGSCYLLVGESACTGRLVQDNGSDVVRCTGCRARWVTAQELAMLEVSLSDRRSA